VAFLGQDTGGGQGVYVYWAGLLTTIANLTTPIPGGTGRFTGFSGNPALSGNNAAFLGTGSSQAGVYLDVWPNGLITAADMHTPIPGANGGTFARFFD